MPKHALTKTERAQINELVDCYKAHQPNLRIFLKQILPLLAETESELYKHVHSFKSRIKDPDHLRDKLERKLLEAKAKKKTFGITIKNLFVKVNDLVGIRILHLHTRQVAHIDSALKKLLTHASFRIAEGPFARTWDDETKEYFNGIGIETRQSGSSLYTSVHYVVDSYSKTKYTAEIQVRTLAEELWGEVAHTIDYPKPCSDVACREQIRVLARVTSSCSRLVDAIFKSHEEFKIRTKPIRRS